MTKIMTNPLCEECIKINTIEPATQVHHITPFMQGTTIEQIRFLGFDYNNLMSLCEPCHQKKHQL
jgi:5-methylcytosine-specific restriction protein A